LRFRGDRFESCRYASRIRGFARRPQGVAASPPLVECEALEAKGMAGASVDLDLFGQLVDRLGRTLARLGIRRQPRDVTPDLRTYIADKAARRSELQP
jgi:hypothetical protein